MFLKALKPYNYLPCDLSEIKLYSMIYGKRISHIPNIKEIPFNRKIKVKIMLFNLKMYQILKETIKKLTKIT